MPRPARFVFVIPVKRPEVESVGDYRIVERLLRNTVESLFRQTVPDVAVVVVCHEIPAWAETIDGAIHFLVIKNEPDGLTGLGAWDDMGVKITLGCLFASRVFGPSLIMHIDGDDLASVHIAERLLDANLSSSSPDGFMISRGAEVLVKVTDVEAIETVFAVEVTEFDRGCGSCRVFEADRLDLKIRDAYPNLARSIDGWQLDTQERVLDVPHPVLGALSEDALPRRLDWDNLAHAIGRHVAQEQFFRFSDVDWVAAAKVCGHGNHSGPAKGSVHWKRVVRSINGKAFAAEFGLPDEMAPGLGISSHVHYGLFRLNKNKSVRRFLRLFGIQLEY